MCLLSYNLNAYTLNYADVMTTKERRNLLKTLGKLIAQTKILNVVLELIALALFLKLFRMIEAF